MGEVFTAVASGFAVVSLAIQVAENIKRLKSFCGLIKDATEEVLLAVDELEMLSLVLEDIDQSMQEQLFLDPRVKAVVLRSYRLCRTSGQALASLVSELEEDIVKGKKRASLKAAWKKEKIDVFRRRIESAKSAMFLANQIYYQAIQKQNWESYESKMSDVQAAVSSIPSLAKTIDYERQRGAFRSLPITISLEKQREGSEGDDGVDVCIERLVDNKNPNFGYWRRRNWGVIGKQQAAKLLGLVDMVMSEERCTSKTSLFLVLPTWIYARKFELHLMKSRQGWDQSLRSYRVVSYNAQVFNYSMAGDVEGLQRLFANGEASPFEIDPDGRTPLHYAALYARPGACRFLLENGSDANARTSWYGRFSSGEVWHTSGWYLHGNIIKREEVYRGWPAYSTPLHLLAAIAGPLVADGRRRLTCNHYSFDQPIEDDVHATVKELVTTGNGDPFYQDQYGFTAFHAFTGPCSTLEWMKNQEGLLFTSMCAQDCLDILMYQFLNTWQGQFETVNILLPPEKMTRDLVTAGYKGTGLTLLSFTIAAWSAFSARAWDEARKSELRGDNLVAELIVAGSDPHQLRGSGTILTQIIKTSTPYGQRTRRILIRKWLRLLKNAGIDLLEYGRVEKDIHSVGSVPWTLYTNVEETCHENFCNIRLLKLETGENPEDWYLNFEDLYVSTPLAAQFWEWVEDTYDEKASLKAIPGAWPDEE